VCARARARVRVCVGERKRGKKKEEEEKKTKKEKRDLGQLEIKNNSYCVHYIIHNIAECFPRDIQHFNSVIDFL